MRQRGECKSSPCRRPRFNHECHSPFGGYGSQQGHQVLRLTCARAADLQVRSTMLCRSRRGFRNMIDAVGRPASGRPKPRRLAWVLAKACRRNETAGVVGRAVRRTAAQGRLRVAVDIPECCGSVRAAFERSSTARIWTAVLSGHPRGRAPAYLRTPSTEARRPVQGSIRTRLRRSGCRVRDCLREQGVPGLSRDRTSGGPHRSHVCGCHRAGIGPSSSAGPRNVSSWCNARATFIRSSGRGSDLGEPSA